MKSAMMERSGMMGMVNMGMGEGMMRMPTGMTAGGGAMAGMNMMMVPRCTMKMEKCTGGMKVTCTCDDPMTLAMMCNGMTAMSCNMTMGMCKCEMTKTGCTITCTSGDKMCCQMIQACCDCMMAMMDAGCACCMMMNNMPVCCGCC